MARKLFGTDGIRGTANSEPMTPETTLKVAMAVGECFQNGAHKHLVVIGKDTRLSGYMLEPALTAGFVTMGMDVVLVGPLPTPAIAMLTRSLRADLGVVLSASHNPYRDNGIKLFGRDGYKLSDEFEQKIETCLDNGPSRRASPGELRPGERLEGAGAGRPAGRRRYGCHRKAQPGPGALSGGPLYRAAPHEGRGPPCRRKNARARLQSRWRAVRPHHPVGLRDDRRRLDRGSPSAGLDRRDWSAGERGLPFVHSGASAAAQCAICGG